jgi:putative Ca2+/H+ antiporter (TMEM165/GDT1 family)
LLLFKSQQFSGVAVDWKYFGVVFAAVFIAELGDKTQLATMLFASDKEVSKWVVFFAASTALIATSAIGVIAGSTVSEFVSEKTLALIAGIGFIAVGVWTLYSTLGT